MLGDHAERLRLRRQWKKKKHWKFVVDFTFIAEKDAFKEEIRICISSAGKIPSARKKDTKQDVLSKLRKIAKGVGRSKLQRRQKQTPADREAYHWQLLGRNSFTVSS